MRFGHRRYNQRAYNSGPDVSVSVDLATVTVAGLAPTVSVSVESATGAIIVEGLPPEVSTGSETIEPVGGGITWTFPERRVRGEGLDPTVSVSVEASPARLFIRGLPPVAGVSVPVETARERWSLSTQGEEELLLLSGDDLELFLILQEDEAEHTWRTFTRQGA